MQAQAFNKTRLAPTPSGFLHLGNLLSFSITALLARQTGAGILLRIDDMDRERVRAPYIGDIFESLEFLGIPWNEGPRNPEQFEQRYSQRHRMKLYEAALAELLERKLVYACDCSRTQVQAAGTAYPGTCRHRGIPLNTPNTAWRLNTDNAGDIRVKTTVGSYISETLPPAMHDVIVRKKDGFPAYQLSSVIDDAFFGIDLVVRGQDLWDSTLVQLYIARLLEKKSFLNAAFCHHTLLQDSDQRKLSKSAGDTSIHYLRGQGLGPHAIYGLLSRQLQMTNPAGSWQDFEDALNSLILK